MHLILLQKKAVYLKILSTGFVIKGVKKDKESHHAFTPKELKLIGEKGRDSYLYPLACVKAIYAI
jgi:hypothetical protein